MQPTPRLLRRAAALAGLCLTLAPAAASADSIVFIKDSNVWLGKPDGTGLYQVTTDGTYASPYRSPSQADDGIIAVGHGDEILRMKQNGTVLNRLNPYPLTNSVSHPIDGPAVDVAISPDGSKIAYTFVSYECPVGASCGARGATGYTAADHLTPPQSAGTSYFTNPSWVTSTRTLQFGGYGSQVNIHDVGTPAAVHWFDDSDYAAPSEDLGDGEVSRDGTRIALVRSYDANTHLIWWKLGGNAQAGAKPAIGDPLAGCVTGKQAGTDGPTWSPDGNSLAWKEMNAGRSEIWVKPQVDDCGVQPRLLFAGGSEPDWGPAAVNPGPRATTGGGPTPGGGPATGGGRPPTTTAALAVKRVKLGKALRSGVRLTLKGAKPGRRAVVAKRGRKVVARGTAKVGASGTASVTLRFTKAGKRALRRAAKVKLVITGAGARTTITLKR